MRSSSRSPLASKMQTSTLVAFAENKEKFVPFSSQFAPRGWGEPSRIRDFMISAKGMSFVY